MSLLFPEYSFADVSIEKVHNSLLLDGCCLLRNAFKKEAIELMANQITAITHKKAEQVRTGELTDDEKRFHIFDTDFQEYYPGQSFFQLIQDSKMQAILESIFGKNKVHQHPHSLCRGIDSRPEEQRDLTSLRPLIFHIDTAYHAPYDKFAINFWIPLQECGVHSPGMQVVPIGYATIRRLVNFNSEIGFSELATNPSRWSMKNVWEQILKGSPDAIVWRPVFHPGDVLMMTSWIPHASYTTEKMTLSRRSIEIRYHGETLDPLPLKANSLEELGLPYYSRTHLHGAKQKRSRIVRINSLNKKPNILKKMLRWE